MNYLCLQLVGARTVGSRFDVGDERFEHVDDSFDVKRRQGRGGHLSHRPGRVGEDLGSYHVRDETSDPAWRSSELGT